MTFFFNYYIKSFLDQNLLLCEFLNSITLSQVVWKYFFWFKKEYKFIFYLILTLYFSLAFFIGNNLIGISFHRENFFVLFLPEGVPVTIIPFLILIEYVSYISRIFSLAIRLFANMMSGHILLKILISFIWAIASSDLIHCIWIALPISIVFLVVGLEFAIAFLQAYVFVVLISIYLNDVINTH